MNIDKLVAANARKLRNDAGLTQEQLSERSGVSAQHISRIERAACSTTVRRLNRLANSLEVDVVKFFDCSNIDTLIYIYTDLSLSEEDGQEID